MIDRVRADALAVWHRLPADVRVARSAVRARPPIFTIAVMIVTVMIYVRLQVGGTLPMLRFLTNAYSPRALAQGHFGLLATSTLLTQDIFMLVSICISLLVSLGTYEVIAGHLRTVVLAIVAAVLGPALVSAALGLLVACGSAWAESRLGTLDIGSSALVAAASGGVAGIARNNRFTAGLVIFLIGGLIVHHRIADWEHLMIFPVGYSMGRFLGRSKDSGLKRRTAHAGVYLIATTTITAVGLVVAAGLFPSSAMQRNAAGVAVSPQRIVDTDYPAASLGGTRRRVLILLPAGYDSTHDRYPVVELLHGYPGRPEDLFSLGSLQTIIRATGIAPFIAVIPDGNGPHRADSWFANIPRQRMGTAATNDLRPWVAKRFRITKSWSYAGLSSGGYAAAYLPSVDIRPVHAVCGLSGYYSGARLPLPRGAARRAVTPIYHLNREPSIVFLAYGRGDLRTSREALKYSALLRRTGRHVTLAAYAGKHQWVVWRPAFRDCFRTILPGPGR